jgi:thiol:disulfide interchange protein DsbD
MIVANFNPDSVLMRRFSNSCFVILLISVSFLFAKAPVFNMNNDMKAPKIALHFSPGPLNAKSILTIFITIDSAWHINSNQPADDFLLPTRIEVAARGLEFAEPIWPTAHKLFIKDLGLESLIFEDSFAIVIPVKSVAQDYDSLTTQMTLKYQACSGSICLAPSKTVASLSPVNALEQKKKSSDLPVTGSPSLLLLLVFAFMGGLILNLMPCVLPVLSIKTISLANHARESRRKLLALGLAMTLGILASFWTLAAAVIAMQAAGVSAGWGFQFQSPGFIVAMIVVITLFALNMFGLFEIWLPTSAQTSMSHKASRHGLAGSFMNGILMTLLSTPCSAPFLGTAMGFAFTQPPMILVLFFSVAGLGLATPYLMLSIFPQTLRWIPKPGNWMVRFKEFLGFLMLITAVWLLWVLGRSVGMEAMGIVLLLLVSLGFGSWVLGLLATPSNPYWKFILGWMVLACFGFMGWVIWLNPILSATITQEASICPESGLPPPDQDGWIPWSPATMETLQSKNTTIFVDYTADWCITCKAVEKGILSQDTIQNTMKNLGVVRVKADFTRPNPDILNSLKSFGRTGVPLFVVYPATEPANPIVLPEIITQEILLDALLQAGPSQ